MFEPTLVKLCYGCEKVFPHDLVECPVCSRTLVYPPQVYAPPDAPEPEPDFTGEGEPITDSDPGPDSTAKDSEPEKVSQDNGDSIYPG
jgi:hypothetical protein